MVRWLNDWLIDWLVLNAKLSSISAGYIVSLTNFIFNVDTLEAKSDGVTLALMAQAKCKFRRYYMFIPLR